MTDQDAINNYNLEEIPLESRKIGSTDNKQDISAPWENQEHIDHSVGAYWLYAGDKAFSYDPGAQLPLRISQSLDFLSTDVKPIVDLDMDQAKKLLTFLQQYFQIEREEEKDLSAKEQLQWCEQNNAIVRFMDSGVKVGVRDFSSTFSGKSLQEIISCVEKDRNERKLIAEALESLKRDKNFPTSHDFDR